MKTILCIPGLGGKANIFDSYKAVLAGFNLETVDLIDWRKTEEEVCAFLEKHEEVILFCSCYGSQIALRAMKRCPTRVTHLVVVEPFFGEFLWWKNIAIIFNILFLWIVKFAHSIGIKRKKFYDVDYNFVERQPLFLQPLYDLSCQSVYSYLEKTLDILSFQLPAVVDTNTLFIFSNHGFISDPQKRERLKKVFIHSELVEIPAKNHTIMSVLHKEIGNIINTWLAA